MQLVIFWRKTTNISIGEMGMTQKTIKCIGYTPDKLINNWLENVRYPQDLNKSKF